MGTGSRSEDEDEEGSDRHTVQLIQGRFRCALGWNMTGENGIGQNRAG